MYVMMSKEQFDVLKQKAKTGGKGADGEKLPELKLKEGDEENIGTIETDDVIVDYFYNAAEGRLNFSVSKRKSLAAYIAGDNIVGTYLMEILSELPNPPAKKHGGAKDGDGGSEGTEKKEHQHQS